MSIPSVMSGGSNFSPIRGTFERAFGAVQEANWITVVSVASGKGNIIGILLHPIDQAAGLIVTCNCRITIDSGSSKMLFAETLTHRNSLYLNMGDMQYESSILIEAQSAVNKRLEVTLFYSVV